MKKVMIILVALMMIASPMIAAAPQKTLNHISVKVNGLVCAFCAQGIKKRFIPLPAIQSVAVSLETKTVVLELKPNTTLSDKEIVEVVKSAGFTTVKIDR